MKEAYFYKIYLNDIDNIITYDTDTNLVEYLKVIRQSISSLNGCSDYFKPPNKCIYIVKTFKIYGWMMEDRGYNYFLNHQCNYVYGGEYLSKIKARKLKLDKINGI